MPGSEQSFFIYYWAPVVAYIPFVFAFGAIVGSFLNVVILRMPQGLNIVTPPSRCPKCDHRLKWHENLPIIGWLRLRGKCASCKMPISAQYPLIEALVAVTFTAVFILYFLVNPRHPHGITDFIPMWATRLGLENAWPLLILHFVLLAALLAMTVIDARTYTIPIQITWSVTVTGLLVHAIMPIWPASRAPFPIVRSPDCINLAEWTIPLTGPVAFCAAGGAMLGLGISILLMRMNLLRLSFLDFDLWVKDEAQEADTPPGTSSDTASDAPPPHVPFRVRMGNVFKAPTAKDYLGPLALGVILGVVLAIVGSLPMLQVVLTSIIGVLVGIVLMWVFIAIEPPPAHRELGERITTYPHSRRELSWELDYLGPIVLGLIAGAWVGLRLLASGTDLPLSLAALGGATMGYLVGAGLVWGIRIFGTLAFGKEAMGLGDAHLLGCVGAVLGWVDPIIIFFMAPFLTISVLVLQLIVAPFRQSPARSLPFGPWLCLATVVTMFCGHWIAQFLSALMGICIVFP